MLGNTLSNPVLYHQCFENPKLLSNSIRFKSGNVEVFDLRERKYRKPFSYTTKQKRLYHATFSGLQVGFHKKELMFFLTLTTYYKKFGVRGEDNIIHPTNEEERIKTERSKLSSLLRQERILNKHFELFFKNISYFVQKNKFRLWFEKNYVENYPFVDLSTRDGRRFFREKKRDVMFSKRVSMWDHFRFKMCYLKVRTTEGGGVIHCIVRLKEELPFVTFDYLKELWYKIHGAKEGVDIEPIGENLDVEKEALNNAMTTSFYVCGNYFNQQPVVRQSSSFNWIFKGSMGTWRRGKKFLGLKKTLVEREYGTYPDKRGFDVNYTIFRRTQNIQYEYKSFIDLFMNSRKSLRKDSGYDNALFQWLLLCRNPPPSSRQTKFATNRKGKLFFKCYGVNWLY